MLIAKPAYSKLNKINIKFENGYLYNKSFLSSHEDYSITKIKANLSHSFDYKNWKLRTKNAITPEFFSNKDQFYSIRNNNQILINKYTNNHQFIGEFCFKYHSYLKGIHAASKLFKNIITWQTSCSQLFFTSFQWGYIKDVYNNHSKRTSSSIFINHGYHFPLPTRKSVSLFLYYEYFSLAEDKNHGHRFGPKIKFSLQNKYIISTEWSIYYEKSRILKKKKIINHYNLLFGKIFAGNYSIFFNGNLQFNNSHAYSMQELSAIYLPIKNEYSFQIKIEKDISLYYSIYLRGNYFNDTLIFKNKKISGYELLFGFQANF